MIHVITAVHNRAEITERFVRGLRKQTYNDIHLILIDDGSTDSTVTIIKKLFPNNTIIYGNGNLWWGGALQEAYKWIKNNLVKQRDEYILISNDDVQYDSNYIETGISHLNEIDKGMVLGQGYSINSGKLIDTIYSIDYSKPWNETIYVPSISNYGNCSSTRSLFLNVKTFLDIGGFHPILLPHYGSDYEWTIRAARKGYKIYIFKDLKYYFDENTTGDNRYGDLTIKKIMSKRSNTNPFYRVNSIILSTPPKYIPREIGKQFLRYINKSDIAIKVLGRSIRSGRNIKNKRHQRVLVNFADEKFKSAQRYNTEMAYHYGKFDIVWEYSWSDAAKWMNEEHKKIMENSKERFAKYGLWRPYLIQDALKKIEAGDYLFYLDSGAFFIKSVELLIREMKRDKQYIMCFDIPTLERQWTKRDVFVYMKADIPSITNTPQRMSGMFLVKKCKKSVEFFDKFVDIAEKMPSLFTDGENKLGFDNYPEYIENRHNQSVFSILTKKYGISAYHDPTEMGEYPKVYAKDDRFCYTETKNKIVSYQKVIISHRYPEITNFRKLKLFFRKKMPAKFYFGISFTLEKIRKKLI